MFEGERFPGSLDPVAILIDEGFDLSGPCTLRHDHFDAAPWKDLDRQSARSGAFTHVEARLEAGLVVFGKQW